MRFRIQIPNLEGSRQIAFEPLTYLSRLRRAHRNSRSIENLRLEMDHYEVIQFRLASEIQQCKDSAQGENYPHNLVHFESLLQEDDGVRRCDRTPHSGEGYYDVQRGPTQRTTACAAQESDRLEETHDKTCVRE